VETIASLALPETLDSVRVSGVYAFASAGNIIEIVEIHDPAHPKWLGTYSDNGEPRSMTAVGDKFYVADGSGGLKVVSPRFGTNQTLNYTIPTAIPVGSSVDLIASSTSGLPVSFSLLSGPASLDGSKLAVTGQGEIRLRAFQAGDATFLAAEAEFRINIPAPPNFEIRFGDPFLELHWPSNDLNIRLEQSDAVSFAKWIESEAPVAHGGAESAAFLSPESPGRFYRLRRD
jgi:hypothetical protein